MALSLDVALAVTDAVLSFSLAFVVFAVAPARSVNRSVAVLLFFEGVGMAASGVTEATLVADPATATGAAGVLFVSLAILPGLYLLVLRTLDTPLVRPLRARGAQTTILLCTLGLALLTWRDYHVHAALLVEGQQPLAVVVILTITLVGVVSLFGLLAAAATFVRARRGTMARTRARMFLLAFGIRDALFGFTTIALTLDMLEVAPMGQAVEPLGIFLPYVGTLLFVPLLAYGILHSQLFDIDLRLKWTLHRGTLVAIFFGVFVIVAQLAEAYLQGSLGWIAGGAAAALLLFVLRPIERLADRVANAALPGVSASPDYVAFRKLEVYKSAVEAANETGGISARERASLRALREKLGIGPHDADRIERDVLEGGAAAAER